MELRRCRLYVGVVALATVGILGSVATAGAQGDYGSQARANAATDAINLAVTQAISQLPPASGQSFVYRYDPKLGTFAADTQLGPTVFRSTNTVGAGRFALRLATSYFDLSDEADPIDYKVDGTGYTAVTAFGMATNTKVTTVSFGGSYGITDRMEVTLNIPMTIVRAQASQVFPTAGNSGNIFALDCLPGQDLTACQDDFQAALDGNLLRYTDSSFAAAGASFNDGTHVGLSRISLGLKGSLWTGEWFSLGAQGDFYMPSPNSDEFAGSDTGSFLPRLLAEARVAQHLNLYTDVGYDCDYSSSELRRFVWNAGLSVPVLNATFDAGVGGSQYNSGLRWTPVNASGTDVDGNPVQLTAISSSDTRLGTTYVDFIGGIKMALWGQSAITGAVDVPLTSDGLRPTAIGTVALEYYF